MKTKLLFRLLLFPFAFFLLPCTAQVPLGFNYQAIARNATGVPITNHSIPVRISIVTALTGGTVIWQEEHSTVTTDQYGLISLVVGTGTKTGGSAASFSAIDWSAQTLFLKTEVKYPGPDWTDMGTSQIWAVPYSLVAKSIAPLSKLGITGTTSDMEEALFEVKNKSGQTVFAVYNEGIRAYVGNGDAKGKKGGFSVGGYGATKGSTIYDLFTLSTDSARLYFDSKPTGKGKKGGFSVGGYDMTKDGVPVQNYLDVSKDSVRIYIDSNPLTKGKKGGFAVGGYDMTKSTNDNYLNVNTDASGIIKPVNRILWYPIKNAFLAGNIRIGTPDSVGINSFATGYQSKSRGMYSQAMGFKAIANGDYSTAIGKNAVANNINSFAFGDSARAIKDESYALGRGAVASGYRSFAFGSAGIDSTGNVTDVARALGDYSFAIGQGSQTSGKGAFTIGLANKAQGNYSVALGYKTNSKGNAATTMGAQTTASGFNSTAIGSQTMASGDYSIAMGYGTTASGFNSTSMGYETTAIGNYSIALGFQTSASHDYSIAMGYQTTANSANSIAMGCYSKAFGQQSTAMGGNTMANGMQSTAIGGNTIASGMQSTAMGGNTVASGFVSTAMGSETTASGDYSTAMGYNTAASGGSSTAMGWRTNASGYLSTAMGENSKSTAYCSLVIGKYNETTSVGSDFWMPGDPIFIVGNGTSDSDRKNAFTILKNGRTAIGLSSPTEMLDVNGNARFRSVSSGTFTYDLNITIDGILTTSTSDVSMKENIFQISDALDRVMKLRGVFFNWKNDSAKTKQIGMIAQEVEPVVPEIVFTNPVDGLKGINYSQASALFVEAIKEQQKQIEGQHQQIESQQKEIDDLKTLVNSLIASQTAQVNKQ